MSCHDLISKDEILSIYSTKTISKIWFREDCAGGINPNVKEVEIGLLDKDMDPMLIHPIKRTYFRDLQLKTYSGTGKVAKHDLFVLKQDYRRKGFAKEFHKKELPIYKSKEFNEIHLDAAFDGVIVWKKLGYSYEEESQNITLLGIWKRYFMEMHDDIPIQEKYTIMKGYKMLSDVPIKYTNQFGEWLDKTYKKTLIVPMYQRIEL